MTGHRIGTYQIAQTGRRNSAQRGEATPAAEIHRPDRSVMVARKNCKIFQNSRQKCLNRFGDSWLIPYAVMALARRDRTGRSPPRASGLRQSAEW